MLTTANNYIKNILILSCFALGGCYNTGNIEDQQTIALLAETPLKETVNPSFQPEGVESEFCYFIPPQGWDLADMSKLSSRVKICFIGKSSNNLLPSVNLATEAVDISLKSYIDIVKKDCESDPNCLWRDLGKYNTSLGEGRLTEREVKTKWGISRQVQLIVIKDGRAYILTAGALKEEFSGHYKDFEGVLRSLTITNDLTTHVPSAEKKEILNNLIENLKNTIKESTHETETAFDSPLFQKKSWEPFQEKIINDFTEMGPYWQILLLRDVQHQLLQKLSETFKEHL